MNTLHPIFDTDSYKASHFKQYPPKTEYVYSYVEARTGKGFDKVVFFGLQYIIKNILTKQLTKTDVETASKFFNAHMGVFNEEGWNYILEKHNGYLPIQIQAIPEGTVVSRGVPLITIVNTDPNCFWLTQLVETIIVRVWSTINVATISYNAKLIIKSFLEKTSDVPVKDILPSRLQDFGSRGSYCQEAAAVGGMGHLVNFAGSDTVVAMLNVQNTYNISEMVAYSIPATEHSTTTSWGKENECDVFENMINAYGGKVPYIAMVMDSYDLENAVKNYIGTKLKDKIINCGSTIVCRPDSGEPTEVVVKTLQWLEECFGSSVNSKGYKVLTNCVRVIQGDGITIDSIPEILQAVVDAGFSTENIVMGMGGGLLQQHNRDTFRFAQKCSAIRIDGLWTTVQKIPATDMTKASKAGIFTNGMFVNESVVVKVGSTTDEYTKQYTYNTVYSLDELMDTPNTLEYTFDEVRKNTGLW